MIDTATMLIGAGEGGANPKALELKRAQPPRLIAGAIGTGKTVTIQDIDGLSEASVPCSSPT